ncbi:unnamed protein product [Nyctereutes procyonoides]|uniref:(raccoon dog) hypothetical protein n=1 Tax=Nyctereutes procyonoides TaxID=34880 RepID=A0A811Y108_NYCPR|nr:unnamed protein product [Nyctereutes procyonoides]
MGRVPSALGARLLAETPEHRQSCQTISLPGLQYLRGPGARRSAAASPRPYIGKSRGNPVPSRLGARGGRGGLGLTLATPHTPSACLLPGVLVGRQRGASPVPPAARPAAGAASDQIRLGLWGLDRLTEGGGTPRPPSSPPSWPHSRPAGLSPRCPRAQESPARAEPGVPLASPGRGGPLGPLECSIWNLQKLHLGSQEEDSCNSWAATGAPPPPPPSLARAAACPPLPALHAHTCPCTLSGGGVCCFPSPMAHQAHPSALPGAQSMRSEGEASQRAIGWGRPGNPGKN